jgi:hypothetical protein
MVRISCEPDSSAAPGSEASQGPNLTARGADGATFDLLRNSAGFATPPPVA